MQRHFVRRTIALLTALILAFCLVFSSAYFGVNADHECLSSEDCPICTEMSLCSELTHALGSAAPSEEEERPAAPSYPTERRTERRAAKIAAATPVSLKVKLID